MLPRSAVAAGANYTYPTRILAGGGEMTSSSVKATQVRSWRQLAHVFPGLAGIARYEHDNPDNEAFLRPDAGKYVADASEGSITFRCCQCAAVLAWHLAGGRGILRFATGGGKSLIASAIAGSMFPKKSLVLVHGNQLHAQTYETFQRFLGHENVGVISQNVFEPSLATVASIDSIAFYLNALSTEQRKRLPSEFHSFHVQHNRTLKKYLKNEVDVLVFDECVPPDTVISTPEGDRAIADLRIGNVVWGYDHHLCKIIPTIVTHLFNRKISDNLVNINGVYGTLNHPVWTQEDGYVSMGKIAAEARDWTVRAVVGTLQDGVPQSFLEPIQNLSLSAYTGPVLNIETGTGNYFANGILAHNCHHGSSNTWQQIGKMCPAFYRAGLSGTPLKGNVLDDMLLTSLVGPVVFDLDAAWLQAHGYLAPAQLVVRTHDLSSKQSRGFAYPEARKKLLVSSKKRWGLIATDVAELLEERNNRVLVLTGNSVELAEGIAAELEAITPKRNTWEMVSGKTAASKTRRAFDKLRNGKLRCVITTKLADEGIDIPDVNVVIVAGGGKSYVTTLQRIGRGLRKKENDESLLVIEYFVKGNRYLEKHDKARLRTYEEEDVFTDISLEPVC